jgi:hypothetical protein
MIGRILGGGGVLLGVFFLVSFNLLGWRMVVPAPYVPTPAGPCREIAVETNGWHTNLVFDVALLPEEHPLRQLYPQATSLAVGWGDRDAYRTGAREPWRHAIALIPPRLSVLHVAADPGWDGRSVAITPAGVQGLSDYLARAARLDPEGRVMVVSPGQIGGRSAYIEGRDVFHVYNLCNHWTARALRAAGLSVSDVGAWTSESVLRQIERAPRCPAQSGA